MLQLKGLYDKRKGLIILQILNKAFTNVTYVKLEMTLFQRIINVIILVYFS